MSYLEETLEKINLQLFANEGDDEGKGDDKDSDAGGGDKDSGGDKKDDKDGDDAGDKDKKDDKDQDGGGAGGKSKDSDDKLFTQDEIDSILKSRLARAEKKWKDEMESEKKKAAMTEAERLKAEKEEADKKATAATERANQRLIRAEVIAQATKMNIVDPDAAFTLMDRDAVSVDDNDDVKGVKDALALLVKSKPYLVAEEKKEPKKSGDDQGDDKSKKGGFSMNDLIRKAAGRG